MKLSPTSQRAHAFSLIELIIVISVIVIIAAFTLPAMNTVLKGSQLSQGAGLIIGQLNIARQQAIARNKPVEVRFYRFADPEVPGEDVTTPATGKFRAMQLFQVQASGASTRRILGMARPLSSGGASPCKRQLYVRTFPRGKAFGPHALSVTLPT